MSGTGSLESESVGSAGERAAARQIHVGEYEACLARARRELPLAPIGARDLAQMARNPGCVRRLVNGAARVDMAAVAASVFGANVRAHGSPVALATGVAFERIQLKDQARRLFDLFAGAGWLPIGVESFIDVQAEHPDIDAESLKRREALTQSLLEQKLRDESNAPCVIWHPRLVMHVPAIDGGLVYIEPDCLVAAPADRMYRPVEVKSFRHRGPRTSASDLANARLQVAVEILALRDTVSLLASTMGCALSGKEIKEVVTDRCGLITRRRLGMTARISAANVRREIALLSRFLRDFRNHVDGALCAGDAIALYTREGQERLPNVVREDCREFCYLASACEAAARREGLPIALGARMEEAVAIVGTLPRLIAMIEGREVVRTDDECRVVHAFRRAATHVDREVRRVG